jgi:hypothetical protein
MEPIEEPGYLKKRFNIPDELPFTAPEGYFDSLADKIYNQVKLEKKILHESPFSVPEKYFEKLGDNIISRIPVQKKPLLRVSAWYYTMAAAASVILVLGINFLNTNNNITIASGINPNSISSEEISRHLEKVDVDETLLIKAIDPNDIANTGLEQLQVDDKEINKILDETDINDLTNDM